MKTTLIRGKGHNGNKLLLNKNTSLHRDGSESVKYCINLSLPSLHLLVPVLCSSIDLESMERWFDEIYSDLFSEQERDCTDCPVFSA